MRDLVRRRKVIINQSIMSGAKVLNTRHGFAMR